MAADRWLARRARLTSALSATRSHLDPGGKLLWESELIAATEDFDTTASINDRIRTTYDGPLSLSEDYMVWNITKDDIRVRMAIVDEDVWPPPATEKPLLPDPSLRIPYSDMISGGKYDMKDVIQPTYDEINKEYGLNEKQGD